MNNGNGSTWDNSSATNWRRIEWQNSKKIPVRNLLFDVPVNKSTFSTFELISGLLRLGTSSMASTCTTRVSAEKGDELDRESGRQSKEHMWEFVILKFASKLVIFHVIIGMRVLGLAKHFIEISTVSP